MSKLLSDLEQFRVELQLSEHRVGIMLARNGRIFDRLRSGGRVWPETEAQIRHAMRLERRKREIAAGAA